MPLQKADLGLVPADILPERAAVMDFSTPIEFSTIVFMYEKPASTGTYSWWTLFNPLTLPLMLITGVCLLIVILLLTFLELSAVVFEPKENRFCCFIILYCKHSLFSFYKRLFVFILVFTVIKVLPVAYFSVIEGNEADGYFCL
jgi:hypothetical protein